MPHRINRRLTEPRNLRAERAEARVRELESVIQQVRWSLCRVPNNLEWLALVPLDRVMDYTPIPKPPEDPDA